jgi:hypothetical protein
VLFCCEKLGHTWRWLNAVKSQPAVGQLFYSSVPVESLTLVTRICKRCNDIKTEAIPGDVTLDHLNGTKDLIDSIFDRTVRL